MEYQIHENNLEKLKERIAKLAKAAHKLDVPVPTLTITNTETIERCQLKEI